MSWIERMVEDRLAKSAANGELAVPHLEGKPLADLQWERPQGWWADRFVERERSHDRRAVALETASLAQAGFWRCAEEAAVRRAVVDANAAIDRANVNLVATDRLDRFDADDIVVRWRRLRRP